MPLYEYRCTSCGRVFEVLQRLGQGTAGVSCPRCGQSEVEKELSTFAAGASSTGGSGGGSSCSPSGRFT